MIPINDDLANRPNTIGDGGARKWIHAAKIKGRYQRLRLISSLILLSFFYATPWITIGGDKFVKLSFLSESFIMFGRPILIYEVYHFAWLAILLVVTLFFASTLFGRVWCGYACPQTIFIEQIFGRIETFCEGSAAKRILQKSKSLSLNIFLRKLLKQSLYIVVSFSFAFTFVAIFTGHEIAVKDSFAQGVIGVLTFIAWFNGAYWREQFCHIVCPYARFQGIMQDRASRTIGYDSIRGEPRGRNTSGACIDCGLCVRVCPSGIDIRQGASQLECTACARCVDACDTVMTSLHQPKGLIRYDALAVFSENLGPNEKAPRIIRPRLLIYAIIWSFVLGFGLLQFIRRSSMHVQIFSVKGALPYFVEKDRIKNLSNLKIGNQGSATESYELSLVAGSPFSIESPTVVGPIAVGREQSMPILISGTPEDIGKNVRIKVTGKTALEDTIVERKFLGPKQ